MRRRMLIRTVAVLTAAYALAGGPAVAQITSPAPAVADEPPADESAPTPPVQAAPVPEPGTILLVAGPAAVGWVVYWRRRWRPDPAAKA